MQEFFDALLSGDRDAILLAAAIYFAICGVFGVLNCVRIGRWPSTAGVLLSEGVERSSSVRLNRSDEEFEARVRYTYVVDGNEFSGTRLDAWSMMATYNLKALLRLQLRQIEHLGDDKVRVYYHPSRPEKSYLAVPGPIGIMVVGGLCFGAAALLYFARG